MDRAVAAAGFKETFRGAAWSKNCREWVYYDCVLDIEAIRKAFALAECVKVHSHRGTHDGSESGFFCELHKDGVMGHHPGLGTGARPFNPR